jgi:3,4-dihydroxy-2-butanone 4-phosphate synthase
MKKYLAASVLLLLVTLGIIMYYNRYSLWSGGYGREQGNGAGCSMMEEGPVYRDGVGSLTVEEAETIAERYLTTISMKNLRIGKIRDGERHFTIEALSENDQKVADLLIDKTSGRLIPIF